MDDSRGIQFRGVRARSLKRPIGDRFARIIHVNESLKIPSRISIAREISRERDKFSGRIHD
jgi:hypothetical protein